MPDSRENDVRSWTLGRTMDTDLLGLVASGVYLGHDWSCDAIISALDFSACFFKYSILRTLGCRRTLVYVDIWWIGATIGRVPVATSRLWVFWL